MDSFIRVETPLTGLELRIHPAKYIQLPGSQFYFLSSCVKSVTAILDTSESSQAPVAFKVLPKYLLIRTWGLGSPPFSHYCASLCILYLFHIKNFHSCQLEFCRCCHCRTEFCIAGKKSRLRMGNFTLNFWSATAYSQSTKILLQLVSVICDYILHEETGDSVLPPLAAEHERWHNNEKQYSFT